MKTNHLNTVEFNEKNIASKKIDCSNINIFICEKYSDYRYIYLSIVQNYESIASSFDYKSMGTVHNPDELLRFYSNVFRERINKIYVLDNIEIPMFRGLHYDLAWKILFSVSKNNNQFFIFTNSDYLLAQLLENHKSSLLEKPLTLSLNIIYKKRNKIHIKQLSEDEITDSLGTDIFLNLHNYIEVK